MIDCLLESVSWMIKQHENLSIMGVVRKSSKGNRSIDYLDNKKKVRFRKIKMLNYFDLYQIRGAFGSFGYNVKGIKIQKA